MNEARPAHPPAEPPPPDRAEAARLALVSPVAPRPRRPFEGWGTALGRALALIGHAIARVSVLVFGHVRSRSERAYADFQKRDRHTRLRAYAFGSFALLAAVTLASQLYESNSLGAYVKTQTIDFPKPGIAVFIRNDSNRPWVNLRVILNGQYDYQRLRLDPQRNFQVRVDKFTVIGSGIKLAPPDTMPKRLVVECDQGRFEKELR